MLKRICAISMVIIMIFLLTTSAVPVPKKVGISLPDLTFQRWKADGEYMKKMLEKAGYEVDLRYNNNDFGLEMYNIENMIREGCDLLIICSCEPAGLSSVLKGAENANIPVIAYERLIWNSDAVICLIEVDIRKICPLQLEYMERAMGLPDADGPFYMEMFNSYVSDGNAAIYAMNTLKKVKAYIDSGKIIVKSGKIELYETASWGIPEMDQDNVRNLITECNYGPEGTRLDAVWCLSDYQAGIVTQELLAREFYNNFHFGNNAVPVHYVDPLLVTRDNYKEVLIDTGYYTEDELNR